MNVHFYLCILCMVTRCSLLTFSFPSALRWDLSRIDLALPIVTRHCLMLLKYAIVHFTPALSKCINPIATV